MTNMSKATPGNDNTPPAVRVTLLGGDKREVPFTEGWTVSDYLNHVDTTVGEGQGVTLNRQNVDLNKVVEASDRTNVIIVASQVANG